jgi:Zn-dependent protease with chaperone function
MTPRTRDVLVVGWLVLTAGCSTYRGPQSPYADKYERGLSGIGTPDASAIESVGTTWAFAKPADQVWNACLQVIHQYGGIVAIAADSEPLYRLVFIHGQENMLTVPGGHRNSGMVFAKMLDTWVAVAVSPRADGGSTAVSAAWFSPKTGTVTQPPEQVGIVMGSSALDQPPSFEALASALVDKQREIASHLKELKEPEDRFPLVPQLTINQFFYHLATQLYGPERWLAKLSPGQRGERAIKKVDLQLVEFVPAGTLGRDPMAEGEDMAARIERIRRWAENVRPVYRVEPQRPSYEEFAEFERDTGSWASARLRRSGVIVEAPKVERILQRVVDDLKQAAGEGTRSLTVYSIASPELNAWALPNGDVFVCSGLLEALDSLDEVAAVLGHELDHVFEHDTTARLKTMRDAQVAKTTIMIMGAAAGGAAGAAVGAGGAAASGTATSLSASAANQAISNLFSNAITMTTTALGQAVSSSMISGYSQEAELRADLHSAQYLIAAGYDVQAELRMLTRLDEYQSRANQRKELIASGLINCEPGLQKRSEQMQQNLRRLTAPL